MRRPGAPADAARRGDLDGRADRLGAHRRRGRPAPRRPRTPPPARTVAQLARLLGRRSRWPSCAASSGQAGSRSARCRSRQSRQGDPPARRRTGRPPARRRGSRPARCGLAAAGRSRPPARAAGWSAPTWTTKVRLRRAARSGCPARHRSIGRGDGLARGRDRRRGRAEHASAQPDRRRADRAARARRPDRASATAIGAASRPRPVTTHPGVGAAAQAEPACPGASAPPQRRAPRASAARRSAAAGRAGSGGQGARDHEADGRAAWRAGRGRRPGVDADAAGGGQDRPLGVRAVEQVEHRDGAWVGQIDQRRRGSGRARAAACAVRARARRGRAAASGGAARWRRHDVTDCHRHLAATRLVVHRWPAHVHGVIHRLPASYPQPAGNRATRSR